MTGRNKFSKLTENLSPKRRAGIEARKVELREEMALAELRQALGVSQAALAEKLQVQQPAITKMERRADIRVGTLSKAIEAMGGSLEVIARFPEGDVAVKLTNYS